MASRQIFILILALYMFSGQTECQLFTLFDGLGSDVIGVFNRLIKELIIQFSDLDQSNPKVQEAINFVINGANEVLNAAAGDMNAMFNGSDSELQKMLKAIQDGDESISAAAKEFEKEIVEASSEGKGLANDGA